MTQWGVDTLFNPSKRHMDEEKRRLQATRAEVGDNSGGKRIDLESGKVRISRSGPTPDTAVDEHADAAQDAADVSDAADAPSDAADGARSEDESDAERPEPSV